MSSRPMAAIVVAVVFTLSAAPHGSPLQAGGAAHEPATLRMIERGTEGAQALPGAARPPGHPPLDLSPHGLPEWHPPVPGSGGGCPGGDLQWDHGFDGPSALAPEPEVIAT